MLTFFGVMGWVLGAAVAVGVLIGWLAMAAVIVLHLVNPAKAK